MLPGMEPHRPKRGRPKGIKNKPKPPTTAEIQARCECHRHYTGLREKVSALEDNVEQLSQLIVRLIKKKPENNFLSTNGGTMKKENPPVTQPDDPDRPVLKRAISGEPSSSKRPRFENDTPPVLIDEGGMNAIDLLGDDEEEAPPKICSTPPPSLDPAVGISLDELEDSTEDEEGNDV